MNELNSFYYYPVVRSGEGYVEPAHALDVSPVDPSELESYLAENYREEFGRVLIGGASYMTRVFVPEEGLDDYSYVLCDSEKVPVVVQGKRGSGSPDLDWSNYYEWVRSELSYAESLYPGDQTYLWNSFLRPSFRLLDGETCETVGWESVFARDRFMILGMAGSGKTTCLRRMALELASRESFPLRPARVPFYFKLRGWDASVSIEEEFRRLLRVAGSKRVERQAGNLLSSGLPLFLLDGLDEVEHSARASVARKIRDFAGSYPRAGLIVATRQMPENQLLPRFARCELLPFSRSQVAEMSLYQLQRSSWSEFVGLLQTEPEVDRLTQNPLILCVTISQFKRHSTTPRDKARLFKSYIDVLVEEWDSVRGVVRSREAWAKPFRKLAALSRLSTVSKDRTGGLFSAGDLDEWQSRKIGGGSAKELLPLLWVDTSLVEPVDADEKTWKFSDEAFADLLTALRVVESTDSAAKVFDEQLSGAALQTRLRIWSLACGLTQDATSIIEEMLHDATIGDTVRALALAEALSQDLVAERGVVEEAWKFVFGTAEAKIARVEITTDRELVSEEVVDHRSREERDSARVDSEDEHLKSLLQRLLVLSRDSTVGFDEDKVSRDLPKLSRVFDSCAREPLRWRMTLRRTSTGDLVLVLS